MDNTHEGNEVNDELKSYDFTKKTWRDDVTFLVEDQRFYANKAILSIDSPVFEAMFGTNFKEREDTEIPLPGKKPDDFNEFLYCIYPKTQKKIDADNVYKILPLADEYDVKSLVRKCQRYLSSHLTTNRPSTEEVVFCHILATRYKFQSLRDVCATRLSDIGLKEIQSTGCEDTEALLELHKDILMRQGELLERTRTELVDMYMSKALEVETVSACDFSKLRGAIIKFKPCLNISEQDKKTSNPVSLWNITFEVIVQIKKIDNVVYVAFSLQSTFPEEENLACVVDAKIQLRRTRYGNRPHVCFNMKEKEYYHNIRLGLVSNKLLDLIEKGFIVDKHIDLVVYLMAKQPYTKVQ